MTKRSMLSVTKTVTKIISFLKLTYKLTYFDEM